MPLFSRRSSVDLFTLADLNHVDAKRAILYVADDSTVPDTVAPVRAAQNDICCGWIDAQNGASGVVARR